MDQSTTHGDTSSEQIITLKRTMYTLEFDGEPAMAIGSVMEAVFHYRRLHRPVSSWVRIGLKRF